MVQGIFWVKLNGKVEIARIEEDRFCLAIRTNPLEWDTSWYYIDAIEIMCRYITESTETARA